MESVLIGFFGEIFIIPFLIAQVVFIIIGARHLINNSFKTYWLLFSLIALISCSILTFGSILKYRF